MKVNAIPRPKREFCESRCYHIMLRGNGKMDLFHDELDFGFFLSTLKKYKGETGTEIFVYCLMDNHVHLLLRTDKEKLPLFMKKVGVRFSNYFNRRYDHVGHVFQNRYRSECIDSNRYFLSAFRYILRNPESAGICPWREYRWSSAYDYLFNNQHGLSDIEFPGILARGAEHLVPLTDAPIDREFCEPKAVRRAIPDSEVWPIALREAEACGYILNEKNDREVRNCFICNVMACGVTARQLERASGLSKSLICNIYRESFPLLAG